MKKQKNRNKKELVNSRNNYNIVKQQKVQSKDRNNNNYSISKDKSKLSNRKISARTKRKIIRKIIQKTFSILIIIILLLIIYKIATNNKTEETTLREDMVLKENEPVNADSTTRNTDTNTNTNTNGNQSNPLVVVNDWRIALANYENIIPKTFEIELSNIDEDRKFDSRAIKYLNKMIADMSDDGITNIWVQSAYRSVEEQEKLYNNSIKKYVEQGKSKEQAEKLTLEYINKPGASDHNLGLAVDFNYVDESFEELKGFEWLQKNAEDYGFILRYPKNKEEITKIKYEPWHWRFVGQEHAKKMNELGLCLEEYVEYLGTL